MKLQKPGLSPGLLLVLGLFILSKECGRQNREQTLRLELIELLSDEIHLLVAGLVVWLCCGDGWLSNSGLVRRDQGKQFKGERDHTGPGRCQAVPPSLVHSHWSRNVETWLSLVDTFNVLKYFQSVATPASYAIKKQLKAF